jgi:hypothetical protein
MALATHTQTSFLPGAAQEVATGAASAQSMAIASKAVRLCATAACRVAFGANPTAVATSLYLAPNVPENFLVQPGDKVAVIQESAAGKLSIVELGS